jgi:hypothetical protein
MALKTDLLIQLTAVLTKVLDLSKPEDRASIIKRFDWASGILINQADKVWHDRRTIAASATDSLDLAGILVDPLSDLLTLARLKMLLVVADGANVNNVNVTRPATNGVPLFLAAGDGIPVRPNGALLWVAPDAAGVVVTPATGDLIDMVNSGAGSSVIYDVVIIGASA